MPELDPLPPPPRRPVLRPRDGDWDDMTRRVGRRRRARMAAASGAAAGVVALALIVNATSPAFDRLVADPATTDEATPSATPTSSPTPTPTDSPSPVPPPTSPPASAVAPPSAEPSATAAPSPSASATTAPTPDPEHATLHRVLVAFEAGRGCQTPGAEGPGWCVRTPGSATVQSDVPRDYVLDYCRLPRSGSARIDFSSRYEVWWYVARGPDRVYLYGDDKWESTTHSVTVPDGQCVRWTLTWDATGDDGRPLAPGDYGVSIGVRGNFSSSTGPSSTVYGMSLRVVD